MAATLHPLACSQVAPVQAGRTEARRRRVQEQVRRAAGQNRQSVDVWHAARQSQQRVGAAESRSERMPARWNCAEHPLRIRCLCAAPKSRRKPPCAKWRNKSVRWKRRSKVRDAAGPDSCCNRLFCQKWRPSKRICKSNWRKRKRCWTTSKSLAAKAVVAPFGSPTESCLLPTTFCRPTSASTTTTRRLTSSFRSKKRIKERLFFRLPLQCGVAVVVGFVHSHWCKLARTTAFFGHRCINSYSGSFGHTTISRHVHATQTRLVAVLGTRGSPRHPLLVPAILHTLIDKVGCFQKRFFDVLA